MAKKFMYVCMGILALVVAYHLGAGSAQSQLQGQVVGIDTWGGSFPPVVYLVTSEGDVWYNYNETEPWEYLGNPFGGVTTQPTTWSRIKAEFGE
jgi:hypothetical protein